MKKSVFLLLVIALSLTACKTQPASPKEGAYTDSEKLEIARLAAANFEAYKQVLEFTEGKAVIYRNDSVGFIDPKGTLTMLPELKELQSFKNGLAAAATRDDVPCYVDATGKIVQKFPNYQAVYTFEDPENAVFMGKNDRFGLLDKQFKEVIPAKYNQTSFFTKGLFIVETGGKWGAVDKADKTVLPFQFESLGYLDEAGYMQSSKKSGNGYVDQTGKEVVPHTFYNMFPFSENLAYYLDKQEDGKYGVINRKGETIVPPQYDGIENFKNGMAAVNKTVGDMAKWGYVDSTGKEVIPPQYESAGNFSPEGFALVGSKGTFMFIDKKGQKAAFPKLDALTNFTPAGFDNGFAKVTVENGGAVYLDRFGNLIQEMELLDLRSKFFK